MIINQTGGGGAKINGLIEQYKVAAGENISAGDFVEFVNKETEFSAIGDKVYNYIPAKLSENKVFVVYRDYTSTTLRAIVYTLENGTISAGTPVTVNSTANSNIGNYLSITCVNETNVVVFYNTDETDYHLGAVVCTISGTTITVGTTTEISTIYRASFGLTSCLIDTNKVFVTCNNNDYLYGLVCTIDGTTITAGTSTKLSTKSYSRKCSFSIMYSPNNIIVAYIATNVKGKLYCRTLSISGTTITTTGTETEIGKSNVINLYAKGVLLENNKLFVVESDNDRYAYICSISDAGITSGNYIHSGKYDTSFYLSMDDLGKPIYTYANSVGAEMYFTEYSYDNSNNVVINNDYTMKLNKTIDGPSIFYMGTNQKLLLGSSSLILQGSIVESLAEEILIKSTVYMINGIAKQNGVGGEVIEIYKTNLEADAKRYEYTFTFSNITGYPEWFPFSNCMIDYTNLSTNEQLKILHVPSSDPEPFILPFYKQSDYSFKSTSVTTITDSDGNSYEWIDRDARSGTNWGYISFNITNPKENKEFSVSLGLL